VLQKTGFCSVWKNHCSEPLSYCGVSNGSRYGHLVFAREISIMPFEQPIGDPCAFCEVIVGRTDKEIVVETGLTLTLISWRQYEVGQMIVIPRRHAQPFSISPTRRLAL
jgi:hypothetical protein